MTEEEFAQLSVPLKWEHLKSVMDYIISMDRFVGLRQRYVNPDEKFEEEKRNLRTDQLQRWGHVKALYCTHREELNDTLGNKDYEECKDILERIFTLELDDALRDLISED